MAIGPKRCSGFARYACLQQQKNQQDHRTGRLEEPRMTFPSASAACNMPACQPAAGPHLSPVHHRMQTQQRCSAELTLLNACLLHMNQWSSRHASKAPKEMNSPPWMRLMLHLYCTGCAAPQAAPPDTRALLQHRVRHNNNLPCLPAVLRKGDATNTWWHHAEWMAPRHALRACTVHLQHWASHQGSCCHAIVLTKWMHS